MWQNECIIELKNVSKKYGNKVILENASVRFSGANIIAVLGENGVGKSTLFKMISGSEKVDSGNLYINGEDCTANNYLNIGTLINEFGFIQCYTGLKNLVSLAQIQNITSKEKIKDYMELLGLNPKDKTKMRDYSVGMKQKIGIIQAIMEDQDIILLDEPFNGLDEKSKDIVKKLLLNLMEEGKLILITSHLEEDLSICTLRYMMRDDKIEAYEENENSSLR